MEGSGFSVTTAVRNIDGEEVARAVTVNGMDRFVEENPSEIESVISVRPALAGERIIVRFVPIPANRIPLSGITAWSEEWALSSNAFNAVSASWTWNGTQTVASSEMVTGAVGQTICGAAL